jgi:protein ImuA
MLEDLRDRIQRIERSGRRAAETSSVSTGFKALDDLLADGGLKRGTLIEWLGHGEGSGAAALALTVAAHVLREEGILVVIDSTREFYPVAASCLGIPLERAVVVQPDERAGVLWAWEQSLRCPAVAVTLGWIDALDDRLFRRLQLAVETGNGLGFLLRPPDGRATWATTRIGVKALPVSRDAESSERSVYDGRCLRVWVSREKSCAVLRLNI